MPGKNVLSLGLISLREAALTECAGPYDNAPSLAHYVNIGFRISTF